MAILGKASTLPTDVDLVNRLRKSGDNDMGGMASDVAVSANVASNMSTEW